KTVLKIARPPMTRNLEPLFLGAWGAVLALRRLGGGLGRSMSGAAAGAGGGQMGGPSAPAAPLRRSRVVRGPSQASLSAWGGGGTKRKRDWGGTGSLTGGASPRVTRGGGQP